MGEGLAHQSGRLEGREVSQVTGLLIVGGAIVCAVLAAALSLTDVDDGEWPL